MASVSRNMKLTTKLCSRRMDPTPPRVFPLLVPSHPTDHHFLRVAAANTATLERAGAGRSGWRSPLPHAHPTTVKRNRSTVPKLGLEAERLSS